MTLDGATRKDLLEEEIFRLDHIFDESPHKKEKAIILLNISSSSQNSNRGKINLFRMNTSEEFIDDDLVASFKVLSREKVASVQDF